MCDTEPQTLLFETSPYGNVDAIVQSNDRTVYFFLNGRESFGVRACWVRNLVPGPWEFDRRELEQGIPPLLPKLHAAPSMPSQAPRPNDLTIVWFEEGNGAALLEGNQILAVIPPWSGIEGFHGYARDCTSENQICWPLPSPELIVARIERAKAFWKQWLSPDYFQREQQKILSALERRFGPHDCYFSIDDNKFPPRGLALWETSDVTRWSTVAMSLLPQPNVELSVEDPSTCRHIEVITQISTRDDWSIDEILRRFGGLVAMPWRKFTWLGHGHTCEFRWSNSVRHAILVDDHFVWKSDGSSTEKRHDCLWELPPREDTPSRLLWFWPLSGPNFASLQTGRPATSAVLDQTATEIRRALN